jgi:hypothetical protein
VNGRKSRLWSGLLWFLFAFGTTGAMSVSHFLDGANLAMATVTMLVISTLAGSQLARREPLESLLASRKTQWFLFVANLNAAVAAYLFVDGWQGLAAAGGLGVVSLSAGAGLLRRRGIRRGADAAL